MLIFILFSGFYANAELIPQALSWIQYISPIRWVFAAFCVLQFSGVVFTCEVSLFVSKTQVFVSGKNPNLYRLYSPSCPWQKSSQNLPF
jgi:hypothetical protein